MFKKVAFTMYAVKDMARARKFYEETLGIRSSTKSTTSPWVEYDLPGGGCLALTNVVPDHEPNPNAGGLLALEVEDLDALIADLKAKGVTFKSDLIHSPVCRMAVCLDSEGNGLLLHQLKPKA